MMISNPRRCCKLAWALVFLLLPFHAWAVAPNHAPDWGGGRSDVTYHIPDDLGKPYSDRLSHTDPNYYYAYCRRGVKLDKDKAIVGQMNDLKFWYSYLSGTSRNERRRNMFVIKKAFGGANAAICGTNENDWPTTLNPRFKPESLNSGYGSLQINVGNTRGQYYLYRYHRFINSVICMDPDAKTSSTVSQPDANRKKLIILIHGWNPDPDSDAYSEGAFQDLTTNLLEALEGTGWSVIQYHWESSADTDLVVNAKRRSGTKIQWPGVLNATEAAEISHMHGRHLGELLAYLFPNLEKVHILAHSAGSWAARSAALYVLNNTDAHFQITLLDPYMPYEAGDDHSCLGANVMDALADLTSPQDDRLRMLENYYSVDNDFLGAPLPGTQEQFNWRNGQDEQYQVDFQLQSGHKADAYDDHDSPIQFYADSIIDQVQSPSGPGPSEYGWKMSMAYEEVSATGPTAAFSAVPTSGPAPLSVQFTDRSTPGSTPITSWAWDFNNDGTVDSTLQDPNPTFQDVGLYDVKLTVASASGSDSETKYDYVNVTSGNNTSTVYLPGNVPLEMVWIPAGSFMMGRYANEPDSYSDEDPQHQVTFASGFWMGKYEVTQAQWVALMGSNPSYFTGDLSRPVESVSWNAIQPFIAALNAHITYTGQGAATFRLPSEAQWEYACRAGATTRFYWGEDPASTGSYAWYSGNSNSTTHPVGQKLPNAWGLYDMSGNVWERCEDWYHSNYTGAPTDGSAWVSPTGQYRVFRGGSWIFYGGYCRSANRERDGAYPSQWVGNIGFRLAR